MSPEHLPPDFDEEVYLQLNPDVWAAIRRGAFHSAKEHWLQYGHAEQRPYSRDFADIEDFDEGNYLQFNPDVAGAVSKGIFHSGYQHWIDAGEVEGRTGASPEGGKRLLAPRGSNGVNYFGAQKQATGLGSAAAGYLAALSLAAVPVKAFDVPVWHEVMEEQPHWDGRAPALPHNVNFIHQNPDAIRLFRRYYGPQVMATAANIGLWVWELTAVKPEWQSLTRLFQEIWVPSDFCLHAFAPVSTCPVITMPYVVGTDKPEATYSRSYFGIPERAFVFLYVFDAGSSLERKNPHALVRAFRAAFGDRDDVALVLKYAHAELDVPAIKVVEELADAPNIHLLSSIYTRDEMNSLLRAADCFVSPHRAEGFGYGIAESMLLGKPVIATAYSGNMDFTSHDNSYLIDFHLVNLDRDNGPYAQNAYWADPSISHLSKLMQRVIREPEEAHRKGVAARETIARKYGLEAVSRRLRKQLAPRFSTASVES